MHHMLDSIDAVNGSCLKRVVAATLWDSGIGVTTGQVCYNGPTLSRLPICRYCKRVFQASDEGRSIMIVDCPSVHAETRVLIHPAAFQVDMNHQILVTTLFPCRDCMVLAIERGVEAIAFHDTYYSDPEEEAKAGEMALQAGVKILLV